MKQKGSQAVEFALVLPFFILILFAVLDFGILVYNKAIITNASREGARSGVMLSAATWSAASVRQTACNYARNTLITVSSGTTTGTCTGTKDPVINVYSGTSATCPSPSGTTAPTFGVPVALTISYPYSGFSLGSWWSLGTSTSVGSPLTLTACTQMVHE
ncbi:MAG: Flp pilus assembly protein TadG [Litorivivens sp.]|jgi:Flp pilus assembly protein TadG